MFQSTLTDSTLYFGRKPTEQPPRFKLREYLNFPAIRPPLIFGFITHQMVWGMLGNSTAGDCVVAGAAHETMCWSHAAGRVTTAFTDKGVLAEYALASGWNGVVNDPSDTGLDMAVYASHRRKVGLPDASGTLHKIDAYADVGITIDHVIKATYVFGAIGLGLNVPSSALQQFDAQSPWTYVAGSKIEGGHYVPCVGRNSSGNLVCVTWGRLQAMTPEFVSHYLDTAIAYISPDFLNAAGQTPRHFDRASLDADLAGLSA